MNTPQYQFNLGNPDPILTGNNYPNVDYFKGLDEEINRLNELKQRINQRQQVSQHTTTIWDEIDKEVSALTDSQKSILAQDEVYVSIDKGIDLLEGQLRKTKTKKERQFKDDSLAAKYANIELPIMTEGEITKVKTFDTKPMTVEDVMLELKDSDKSFYVFNNSDTQETNVLFRLRDGNFGILEPEK